ncbi:MAG: hypothetical protein R6X27_01030, partial [Candidatus Desulfacyla sp.]
EPGPLLLCPTDAPSVRVFLLFVGSIPINIAINIYIDFTLLYNIIYNNGCQVGKNVEDCPICQNFQH